MNKNNAAQFLPLVQALADGKTIQYNAGGTDSPDWGDVTMIYSNLDPLSYRVKPEPREWVLAVATKLNSTFETGAISEQRTNEGCFNEYWEAVKVREILEP